MIKIHLEPDSLFLSLHIQKLAGMLQLFSFPISTAFMKSYMEMNFSNRLSLNFHGLSSGICAPCIVQIDLQLLRVM